MTALDSEWGKTMLENASPVEEKVRSSTPVMRAPRLHGKVDLTCDTDILWRTTDLRSP